jgi:Lrp/AsnC family transcriptional regulator of ectoine degradation
MQSHTFPNTVPRAVRRPQSNQPITLDATDLEILKILQNDGRISKSLLADMVGLSVSACLERMRRLEKKKLVVSYHAHINVRMIARFDVIFAEVTLKSHRSHDFDRFERYIQTIDAVSECYALGGGIDYLLKFVAADLEFYQKTIEGLLDADIGIEKYFTYVCTKTVKCINSIPMQAVLEIS